MKKDDKRLISTQFFEFVTVDTRPLWNAFFFYGLKETPQDQ